ncbi:MAG: hypothetical protein J0652_12705 [Desulfobulbaceae bacterium]|jgi:hypothetical protein|nr:hypothetical protein [Desulfobulbaceae bacterium]
MSETYTMPPQFPFVAEGLGQPISRLRVELRKSHKLSGTPFSLNNFESECFGPLNRNIESIAAAINQLGQRVMASGCVVSNEYALQMVSSLDRAIARYIYDTDTFLCRPWPEGLETGRVLVAAIMERPLRDLYDLFEQVRFVILDPVKAVARYGGTKINLSMSLDIDLETQAFRSWAKDTEQLITLRASVLSNDFFYRKSTRSSCFSRVLAGFFLGWWLGGN